MEIKTETQQQKISRKSKNAWIRAQGACKRSGVVARKAVSKEKIKARKREFGVRYLDMLERGESSDELCAYLSETQKELGEMKETVNGLNGKLQRIDLKVQERILIRPGTGGKPPKSSSFEVFTGVEVDLGNNNSNQVSSPESPESGNPVAPGP